MVCTRIKISLLDREQEPIIWKCNIFEKLIFCWSLVFPSKTWVFRLNVWKPSFFYLTKNETFFEWKNNFQYQKARYFNRNTSFLNRNTRFLDRNTRFFNPNTCFTKGWGKESYWPPLPSKISFINANLADYKDSIITFKICTHGFADVRLFCWRHYFSDRSVKLQKNCLFYKNAHNVWMQNAIFILFSPNKI